MYPRRPRPLVRCRSLTPGDATNPEPPPARRRRDGVDGRGVPRVPRALRTLCTAGWCRRDARGVHRHDVAGAACRAVAHGALRAPLAVCRAVRPRASLRRVCGTRRDRHRCGVRGRIDPRCGIHAGSALDRADGCLARRSRRHAPAPGDATRRTLERRAVGPTGGRRATAASRAHRWRWRGRRDDGARAMHARRSRREPGRICRRRSTKQNRRLQGCLSLAVSRTSGQIVRRYAVDEMVVAMPAAPGAVVRRVFGDRGSVAVPTRTVPGLYELLSGRKSVSALRKIEIEDLLRREPVHTDLKRVGGLAQGRLCWSRAPAARSDPSSVARSRVYGPNADRRVGRGENSIFELVQELARTVSQLRIEPVIADVRDRVRLERMFRVARPHAVFHAAAHKHVPFMEQNVVRSDPQQRARDASGRRLAARHGVSSSCLSPATRRFGPQA